MEGGEGACPVMHQAFRPQQVQRWISERACQCFGIAVTSDFKADGRKHCRVMAGREETVACRSSCRVRIRSGGKMLHPVQAARAPSMRPRSAGARGGDLRGRNQVDLVQHDRWPRASCWQHGVAHIAVGGAFAQRFGVGQHRHASGRGRGSGRACATAAGSATPLVSIRNGRGAAAWRAALQQRRHQVAAEAAAHAAAGDAEQIAVARVDQVGIDRQLAEVVDQHGDARPSRWRSRWLTSVVLPAPR